MIEGKKVGLASQETRLEELEYINKFSNYNNAQKMELFAILDKEYLLSGLPLNSVSVIFSQLFTVPLVK